MEKRKIRGIPWILGVLAVIIPATYYLTAHVKGPQPLNLDYRFDTAIYMLGGMRVNAGQPLYATYIYEVGPAPWPLPFTYPPFAGALFSMISPIRFPRVTTVTWGIGIFLSIMAVIMMVLRDRLGKLTALAWIIGFLVTVASFALHPVEATVYFGQVNTFLMLLVCMDFLPSKRRWNGVGVGLAAGIKLTPALFGLIFLVQKRWKSALASFGVFLGTVVIGHLYVVDSKDFWTKWIFDPTRVGVHESFDAQDINSVLIRVFHINGGPVWYTLEAVTLAIAALAVVIAVRKDDIPAAVVLTGIAACLISPFSWNHHWVWTAPLLVMIFVEVNRRVKSDRWAGPVSILVTLLCALPWISMTVSWHFNYRTLDVKGAPYALLFTGAGFIALVVYVVYGLWGNQSSGRHAVAAEGSDAEAS